MFRRIFQSIRPDSTEALKAICEAYWVNSLVIDATTKEAQAKHYAQYVKASNELAQRGAEILDWCRGLLKHPGSDAREQGAFLLGQLGCRGQLGDQISEVITELGFLTQWKVEHDNKEVHAVDAAIDALKAIGHPDAIPYIRLVLMSNDPWLGGDSQWAAAGALERLTGQPFMSAEDPFQAAISWLEHKS